MIGTIAAIYGIYVVLAVLAKPSVRAYYEEKHGKDWESIRSDQVFIYPSDYFMFMSLAPLLLPFYELFEFYDHVILPVLQYPGKRLAQNLKGEETRRLPPHKDEITKEAEKEVDEFLEKLQNQ